jgi:alkylation response protein AidB-like acyl-CoA dehydrogenase
LEGIENPLFSVGLARRPSASGAACLASASPYCLCPCEINLPRANLRDDGADVRRVASIAKYVATENCFCVDRAMQIHGGYGYMRESEVERLYRDCRVLRIYEGTSQIQLLTIARALARRRDESGSVA